MRPRLPAWLQRALASLNIVQWEHHLQPYPNHEFVALLLAGMREGFRIGLTTVHVPPSCDQLGATWAWWRGTQRWSISA